LSNKIADFLITKGYKYTKDKTSSKIQNFDNTDSAPKLFSFLMSHPSCVAVFDSIVKSGGASDIDSIYSRLINMFRDFKTSFIYCTQCKRCRTNFNYDISEYDFKLPSAPLKCPRCQRRLTARSSDFEPLISIQKDDLIRFLNTAAENYGLFLSKVALNCVYCDDPLSSIEDINNVDLVCPSCNKIRYVEPLFRVEDDINEIVDKEQGYWLEWFVWKQLEKFGAEHNLNFHKIDDESIKFDVDVCLFVDDKFVIIECKDTGDIDRTSRKLHLIGDIVHKYVLISTSSITPNRLDPCKSTLGDKFEYIAPNDISNVEEIIKRI